jgi:xanthine dehydrogenase YagS FAD-binding subunit
MRSNFAYVRARSVRDAVKHLASGGARLHAGGTDLLGCLRDHVFDADKLVSISKLNALHGIKETVEGGLRIGALTTLTEVAENPIIKHRYYALAQGASEVASPQLRNQGTIGGNLCQKPRCWYYRGEFHCLRKGGDRCYAVGGENQFHCLFGGDMCYIVHPSDTAPALVALGASARIVGQRGTRTVPMEHFHVSPGQDVQRETVLDPDEIVTEIILPPAPPSLRSSYRKVRARRSWDFALAGAALAVQFNGLTVEKARVVFSGVAPVPWRSKEVEGIITGKALDADVAAEAAEAAIQGAEPMEKNGYKVPLLRAVVEEELLAIGQG